MTEPATLAIVLAAGHGTRMASTLPKVFHKIAGRSMLGHALALAKTLPGAQVAVVVGPDMHAVDVEARRHAPDAAMFVQHERLGTAHAVLAAREAIAAHRGDVIVLYGDTPLIEPATLARLRDALDAGAEVAVLGFEAANPQGYGRLIAEGATLTAIREEKDATDEERRITLCNSGVMAFRTADIVGLLTRIGCANAKREYYLTDAISLVSASGGRAGYVVCEADEVAGVNTRAQLAEAEALFQRRARARAMAGGATLIAPETVWFAFDTLVGPDVIIEPNVFFGPGVVVECGVHILAHCHIEGARIRAGARVGPFARLRPGADLGVGSHVGNFVEIKNVKLGSEAKANHLAYLGDGAVGDGANIGAGTIFCNYDGFFKHRTVVGRGAFIGSNSALVAPVTIGDHAYVGSGSVITKDVAPDALALERAPQEERPGWAAKFRAVMTRRKRSAS